MDEKVLSDASFVLERLNSWTCKKGDYLVYRNLDYHDKIKFSYDSKAMSAKLALFTDSIEEDYY